METITLLPDEGCKITNNEDYPIHITWDNIDYVLYPHKEQVVPSDVAYLGWGDPRSSEQPVKWKSRRYGEGYIPPRPVEIQRLRQRWAGFHNNNMFGNEEEVIAPSVTIKTLNGDEILSVVQDPKGNHTMSTLEVVDEQETMRKMMAKLQDEHDILRRTVESHQSYVVTSEDDLPEDTLDTIGKERQESEIGVPDDMPHDDSSPLKEFDGTYE